MNRQALVINRLEKQLQTKTNNENIHETVDHDVQKVLQKEVQSEDQESDYETIIATLKREKKELEQQLEPLKQTKDNLAKLHLSDVLEEVGVLTKVEKVLAYSFAEVPVVEDIVYTNSPPATVSFKWDLETQLQLERTKCNDFSVQNEKLTRQIKQLEVLKINVDLIKKMFGCTVKELIPYQLNDNALTNYGILFDGFYRESVDRDKQLLPRDMSRLISWYYPIFWTLR